MFNWIVLIFTIYKCIVKGMLFKFDTNWLFKWCQMSSIPTLAMEKEVYIINWACNLKNVSQPDIGSLAEIGLRLEVLTAADLSGPLLLSSCCMMQGLFYIPGAFFKPTWYIYTQSVGPLVVFFLYIYILCTRGCRSEVSFLYYRVSQWMKKIRLTLLYC